LGFISIVLIVLALRIYMNKKAAIVEKTKIEETRTDSIVVDYVSFSDLKQR